MANKVHRLDNPLGDALDYAAGLAAIAEDKALPFMMDGQILSRIEGSAERTGFSPLDPTEYTALKFCFNRWTFSERKKNEVGYYIAQRAIPEAVEKTVSFTNDGHRIVLARNGSATILMQHAVLASDVTDVCQIERRALGIEPGDDRRKPENATEPLHLSDDQSQVVRRIGIQSRAQIAEELGVAVHTINTRIKSAAAANGYRFYMTGFVRHALSRGQIDTKGLPPKADAQFTKDQKELLGTHALEPQAQAGAAMGLTGIAVSELWSDIYEQLGLSLPARGQVNHTRTQALLIALRDGLLDEPKN